MKLNFLIFTVLLCVSNSFKLSTLLQRKSNKLKAIPDKIYAAEVHYSRVPYQYWDHRLRMIKAMGFNTISVYIMWNFHELERQIFDFQREDKNLTLFLQLSKKHDLNILLRPGPYICSEWDFGGMPARLLANKKLSIRSNNKEFVDEVRIYFRELSKVINNYTVQNKGNIILLQIQNEYGEFGSDKVYIQALRQIWKDLNITVPQYFVDAFQTLDRTYWQNANIGINGIRGQSVYQEVKHKYSNSYIFGGEIYSGWHTHWGQGFWQGRWSQQFQFQFNFLMSNNHSFSMYMAHGGTNFGLWAGANSDKRVLSTYWPVMTSYDYDAPISEQGQPTEKYYIFRNMAKKYATWQIPDIPQNIQTMEIDPFTPSAFADFFANLPQAAVLQVGQPILFEDQRLKMWNQGFVLYQTYILPGFHVMNITVSDFALVYQDGKFIRALDKSDINWHILTLLSLTKSSKLQILVEAMGHINFAKQMPTDYKGITSISAWMFPSGKVLTPKCNIMNENCPQQKLFWNIYKIPIDQNMLKMNKTLPTNSFPRLFRYKLTLEKTDDTFLNMENWGKGYVFANGKNLGRYWKKGPQKRLYLPGVWLKKDLLNSSPQSIKGQKYLRAENQKISNEASERSLKVYQNFYHK